LYYIAFDKISLDECNTLKNIFNNVSNIICQNNGSYFLEDFLTPAIQALVNKKFVGHEVPIPEKELSQLISAFKNRLSADSFLIDSNIYNIFSNCTDTAYEIVRNDPNGYQFYHGQTEDIFLNTALFEVVLKEIPQENFWLNPTIMNQLETFDVIYEYEKEDPLNFAHTMVFIDHNLVFEKTNPDANVPYRFRTIHEKVITPIDEQQFNNEGGFTYESPRFITVLRKLKEVLLPNPLDILSINQKYRLNLGALGNEITSNLYNGAKGSFARLNKSKYFNYQINPDNGKYLLPPEAFDESTFGGKKMFK